MPGRGAQSGPDRASRTTPAPADPPPYRHDFGLATLDTHLREVAALASQVIATIDERPARGRSPYGIDEATGNTEATGRFPDGGLGVEGALARFRARYHPWMEATNGPRYLGFVTGGTTPAALVGDWLTSTYDNNAMVGGGAIAEIERDALAWLVDALALGEGLTGTFVTGATTSSTTNLAVAREWAGRRLGVSVSRDGLAALPRPIRVLSGAPHSSVGKALSVLGLGRGAMTLVDTLPGREAVDLAAMARALAQAASAGEPAIVVGNAGTVNTVDFDDLAALAELCAEHGAWLHVDGAFGAFAGLVPEHRHLVAGIERADSVTVDLHKWLNVPYDSAVQFTHHPDLQAAVFANSGAYLSDVGARPDPLHLTPENSRRARAIGAWFAMAAYGRDGQARIVADNIANAARFGAGVGRLTGARLAAPVRLNVVCVATDRPVPEVLAAIDADGRTFFTATVYDGRPCLRAAFSNWRTTDADVDIALDALAAALG